jgi:hypothetical protein
MTQLGLFAFLVVVGSTLWACFVIIGFIVNERSRLIILGLATITAIISQAFALLWLPKVFPAGWSSFIAALILVGVALVIRLVLNKDPKVQQPTQPINARLTTLILLLSIAIWVYISSLAFWFEGSAGGADVATLYLHSGLVATISRGNFPVINPFEPDHMMTYRFSTHTLAAATQHLMNAKVGTVLPHFLGMLAVSLVFGVFGIVARLTRSLNTGIFTGLLVWGWGPLYWLGLPAFASREGIGETLALIAQNPAAITWSGVFLGPPFTMATHNPTNIFGLFPALGSIWLVHEVVSPYSRRRYWLLVLLVISLTVLAASSEYYFVSVAAGIVAYIVLLFCHKTSARSWFLAAPLASIAISGLLSITTPSVLASLARGDHDVLRLGAYLNASKLGYFSSWGYNGAGPLFVWPSPNQHEVNILSWEYFIDGGLISIFLVGIAVCSIANPRRATTPFAFVGLTAMLAGTLIHFKWSPADIYRFAHFGAITGFMALGIWGAPAIGIATRLSRLRTFTLGCVGLVSLVGFALSAIAWPGMIAQAETAGTDADNAVVEYLVHRTNVQDRLLVLWGSRTAHDLYDPRTDKVTAHLSANTGQFIPYGYHHLSKANEYSPLYGWAQQSLLEAHLDEMQIRYIYSDPSRLTPRQRTSLAQLTQGGKIRIALNTTSPTGQSRILYEYLPLKDWSNH